MKIAAVVIVYNPGNDVINNILSFINCVEKVYVIDNTEEKEAAVSSDIRSLQDVIYLHDSRNNGIAQRLNLACDLAINEGYEWLLTMDQDFSFAQNDISTYINCVEELGDQERIAMTGVRFTNKENEEAGCEYINVTSLITSGSVINLKLFKTIGVFDEALFIDQVDFEYCYRALLKGYKIIQFKNIYLKHAIGVSSVHKSLKNFKNTYRSLHSPVRIYYMMRNYLYIQSKYKKNFAKEISAAKKDLFVRIKNNLLYSKERIAVLKYILKGIIDFRRKKMGKINEL